MELGPQEWGEFFTCGRLYIDEMEYDTPPALIDPENIRDESIIPLVNYFTVQSTDKVDKPFRFSNMHLLGIERDTTKLAADTVPTEPEKKTKERCESFIFLKSILF